MSEDQEGRKLTAQLEGRWIAFVTAVALFFGGWWLQNQYTTTLRLQQSLNDFIQRVDDKYVEKDYLAVIDGRLARIEARMEALHQAVHEEDAKREQDRMGPR